jgi:hypothetical protein
MSVRFQKKKSESIFHTKAYIYVGLNQIPSDTNGGFFLTTQLSLTQAQQTQHTTPKIQKNTTTMIPSRLQAFSSSNF